MTRRWQLIVTAALGMGTLVSVPGPAEAQQVTVAIAGFETDGSVGLSRAEYGSLARALTAVLAGELGSRSTARLVTLPASGGARGRVDLTLARAGATKAGAKLLVVGSLLDQYGDTRLEARLIDAGSGEAVAIVQADAANAQRDHLSSAVADLADRLAARREFGNRRSATPRATISVAALLALGEGLRLEDEGDRTGAAASYRAALKAAPALAEAAAGLQRVGG